MPFAPVALLLALVLIGATNTADACTEPRIDPVVHSRDLARDGHERDAYNCLQQAADNGHAEAGWELSVINGISQGGMLSLSCPPFDLSPLAQLNGAILANYSRARSFARCEETRQFALRALELGSLRARFSIGWALAYFPHDLKLEGYERPADPWELIKEAAAAGNARAAFEMGLKAQFGPTGADDPIRRSFFDPNEWRYDKASYEWMLKAAEAGHAPAMDALGAANCPGHPMSVPYVKQDFNAAADWLERARAAGSESADDRLRQLLASNRCTSD